MMIPRRRTITFPRVLLVSGALAVFCVCTFLMDSVAPSTEDVYPLQRLSLNNTNMNVTMQTLPASFNSSYYDNISLWSSLFHVPSGYDEILNSMNYLNANHDVRNVDKFGSANGAAFVIVVQVHARLEYLKYLIGTLREAHGIENALLVFSHDLYDKAINDVIYDIDFCRVIQIFYPTNIQIFANVFPGTDPSDCQPMATVSQANQSKCRGYQNPDKYGHYRMAALTQIKHHWWWKMNYVYDGIMKRYNLQKNYVVLLEEDHYVSPDFVHVLKDLIANKERYCKSCQVLSLGFYLKNYNNYESNSDKIAVHPWFTSKHNMAMAFNGDTWEKIRACAKLFCIYDDYNWDWSLLQVSIHCLPQRLRVLVVKAPRVVHVGDCGVHTHRCKVHNAAANAKALFTRVAASLFPDHLTVSEISSRSLKPSKANGGWGDIRDQGLCLANTVSYVVPPTSSNVNMNAVFNAMHGVTTS